MEQEHPWKYMRKNDMYQERMDLYRDFVCDLVNKVHETFLGTDIMGEQEFREHFDWCWSRIIEEFKADNIVFYDECELKEYLWRSFYDMFYVADDHIDELKDNMMIIWNFIFDHGRVSKTKSEINYTIDAYDKFEKCLSFNYG